jgi:shikimate dehydrogenase
MDVTLTGETRLYFIVGAPIAQVKSPPALTAILVARGANALVVLAHVAPADLDAFMAAARLVQNVDGIVVTVPHKIAALAHCDEATERARFAGSTNIIRRDPDGRWRGDNTDGQGYLDGIAARGFDVPGRVAPGDPDPTGVDLVANATPLGMREGDPLPVDVARLVPTQFVADVITKPDPSPLIAAARLVGCATMPGAGMFDAQAEVLVDILLGTARA